MFHSKVIFFGQNLFFVAGSESHRNEIALWVLVYEIKKGHIHKNTHTLPWYVHTERENTHAAVSFKKPALKYVMCDKRTMPCHENSFCENTHIAMSCT